MRALTWRWANWGPWRAGQQDLGIRLQQQWRSWARRWAWAVLAGIGAWSLGVWLHVQTWHDLAEAKHALHALQAQLAAVPAGRTPSQDDASDLAITPLPTADQLGPIWSRMPNILAQHRVRLLAMQPVHETMAAPLPSEAMALRLQARFENWAGLWAQLTQMGPVWSMDRLRVVPSSGTDAVDIEVVWRIWFKPDAPAQAGHGANAPDLAWAQAMAPRAQAPWGRDGASVFESVRPPVLVKAVDDSKLPPTAAATPETPAPAPALPQVLVFSNEPERWPLHPLRVIGIWRHGEQAEAVLANARHWFRVQEGRQISQEGHRVWRIGQDEMQVRDLHGQVQTLKMEARSP